MPPVDVRHLARHVTAAGVEAACGVTGLPRHASTVWGDEVTCPACIMGLTQNDLSGEAP